MPTDTAPTLVTVATPDLQVGDVVHHWAGLLIRLDRSPIVCERGGAVGTVYSWVGLVLNAEEVVASGAVSRAYLRADRNDADPRYRWNVQGNHLAKWSVER